MAWAHAAKRVEYRDHLGLSKEFQGNFNFCLVKASHAAFRSRLCVLLDSEVNERHVMIRRTLFPPESRSIRCLAAWVKLVKQIFGTLLATSKLCTLRAKAAQVAECSSSTSLRSGSLHTQLSTEALQRPAATQFVWWQAGSNDLLRQISQHYTHSQSRCANYDWLLSSRRI